MDSFLEKVRTFNAHRVFPTWMLYGVTLYGAYSLWTNHFKVFLSGFWKHYLRPALDLPRRYGKDSFAVVTGATDGIGKQMALDLAKRGFNIVLIARTKDKLDEVANQVRGLGKKAIIVQFDFSTLNQPSKALELEALLNQACGDISISLLVNNVGTAWGGSFQDIPLERFYSQLIVNCASQPIMTRWFLSRCSQKRKDARSGIIDFSSNAATGETNPSSVIVYGASKAFNLWFSNGVYHEHRQALCEGKKNGLKLDVLTVTPSHVKTNMNSGKLTGTIQVEQLTKSILDQVGWEQQTMGNVVHARRDYLLKWSPFKIVDDWVNARRRATAAAQK